MMSPVPSEGLSAYRTPGNFGRVMGGIVIRLGREVFVGYTTPMKYTAALAASPSIEEQLRCGQG